MAILDSLAPRERILLLAVVACALTVLALLILYRLRMTPLEKERRRRLKLNMFGRMGDAMLADMQGDTLYYAYSVSGVTYNASQDITYLRSMLPHDVTVLMGPVTLKYLPRNPANSIVICEGWSGLRVRPKLDSQQETTQNEATA